jgi:ferredoxin-NADP reductase
MAIPQKLRCKVRDVISHGDHVYTLDLLPDAPPIPRFKPGQFLHLALDPYDPAGFWPESRVFSIASSPLERDSIRFTYSVRGRYTARMESETATGRAVWAKMPYGEFFIDLGSPIVLFAGGTGITAFTAFLSGLPERPHNPVTVCYGARRRNLLVYRSLVDRCMTNVGGFQAFYFLENDEQAAPNELPGLISVSSVWQHIPDPMNSNFYLSGPPAMLRSLTMQLGDAGVKSHRIHIDAWE